METEHSEQETALARQLLGNMPQPAAGANARVAMRLGRTRTAARHRPINRYLLGTGLAAAAAGLFYLVPPPNQAAFTESDLASESGWQTVQSDGVALSYLGTGAVSGQRKAPRIEWQRGTLNVEVTPEHGVDLRVQTREAEVRVLGTGFSVRRDALGTHVEVRHGIVETRCGTAEPVRLLAGDSKDCLPLSAAGLLGRARAQMESDAPTESVLATLRAGVAMAEAGSPVSVELAVATSETLAAASRPKEALAAVQTALAAGAGVRHVELVQFAARLSAPLGGCAVAAPWLLDSARSLGISCDQQEPPAQP